MSRHSRLMAFVVILTLGSFAVCEAETAAADALGDPVCSMAGGPPPLLAGCPAELPGDSCDPMDAKYTPLPEDDLSLSLPVETCAPYCVGFPIPPIWMWDPDIALCRWLATREWPYDPAECSPMNPMFVAHRERKCPDDLPKDQVWLYEACLALSTLQALEQAAELMPPPIKQFAKAAGKGGKKACCDAVFDTEVAPTWECAVKEMTYKKPTYKSCQACCDKKWPILGETNTAPNAACTKSCTRAQGVYGWPAE